MNSKLLGIYLNDHWAASVGGVELAKRLRASNRRSALGEYLAKFLRELAEEQQTVTGVLRRIGIPRSRLKQGAVWLAEKAGRAKLNGQLTGYSPLSRVIELEGLVAGINAKLCLWHALRILDNETLVPKADVDRLIQQAEDQVTQIERFRREAARTAFKQT